MNSINKGSVNGFSYTYGIANRITNGRNIVSMGEINDGANSFTFWGESVDVDLFYGLSKKCKSCNNATLFVFNDETGFYEVVDSREHVHDLLNKQVLNESYGMFWTSELELVPYQESPSPSSSESNGRASGSDHQSGNLSSSVMHGLAPLAVVMTLVFLIQF